MNSATCLAHGQSMVSILWIYGGFLTSGQRLQKTMAEDPPCVMEKQLTVSIQHFR